MNAKRRTAARDTRADASSGREGARAHESPGDDEPRAGESSGDDERAPSAVSLAAAARRLQDVCIARGLTVALAESCTGGLVAHVITEISGSSAYLVGAIVAYSNAVKERQLSVPADVLSAHGAVSAQTARAMAEGVRTRLEVDLAASVTGVAGPDGGTDSKPVGLTYIGTVDSRGAEVRRFVWAFDRSGNKRASAAATLQMLLERAEALPERKGG
jgi:nicotinamide-nucleotide amidase